MCMGCMYMGPKWGVNWPLNLFAGHTICCRDLHPWIFSIPKLGMLSLLFIGDVLSDMFQGGGTHMLQVNGMVPIQLDRFKAFLSMILNDLWFTSFYVQSERKIIESKLFLLVICFSSSSDSKTGENHATKTQTMLRMPTIPAWIISDNLTLIVDDCRHHIVKEK